MGVITDGIVPPSLAPGAAQTVKESLKPNNATQSITDQQKFNHDEAELQRR